ncbi:MAG: D-glucuronyl C5-epimerase family protein, partial [bacterium]
KSAHELFELACIGLKKNLARYDTGYWNLYDLHPSRRLASAMYIKVHVQLLHILADLIDEPYFQMMANKWRKYLTNPICRCKWLVGKATEKIRLRS